MNDSYEGISIQDLDMMASDNPQMMPSQYMQQPYGAPQGMQQMPPQMQQMQQVPQMQPMQQVPQQMPPQMQQVQQMQQVPQRYTHEQMRDFAEHLSDELNDSSQDVQYEQPKEKLEHKSKRKGKKKIKKKSGGLLKNVPESLRVPLVVFLWFIILSQGVVKEKISKFLPQIKPSGETSKVGLSGIVIYGLLFSALVGVSLKLNEKCF